MDYRFQTLNVKKKKKQGKCIGLDNQGAKEK
jgi:hypothetical protein